MIYPHLFKHKFKLYTAPLHQWHACWGSAKLRAFNDGFASAAVGAGAVTYSPRQPDESQDQAVKLVLPGPGTIVSSFMQTSVFDVCEIFAL